ncbi:MAG TPA: hypothetical protein VG496_18300, partial [Myxococcales bacterium]|nr:hypothetical protein [Myxococcales bacterium]
TMPRGNGLRRLRGNKGRFVSVGVGRDVVIGAVTRNGCVVSRCGTGGRRRQSTHMPRSPGAAV